MSKAIFKRSRSTDRWKAAQTYQSVQAFSTLPLGNGLHTIEHDGRFVDLLIRDRGAKTTLIVFHGNLGSGQRTLPFLQGDKVSSTARLNLIACSDPSLELGALAGAWFLGDKEIGPLPEFLTPILQHAIDQLGSEKVILFGGSGGGFAAVNFARFFEGSTALAMNPRLNLLTRPRTNLDLYLEVCHDAASEASVDRIKSEFLTVNLANALNVEQNFDLLLLQNKNDRHYLKGQMVPFLEERDNLERVWVHLYEGRPGHSLMDRSEVARVLRAVADKLEGLKDSYQDAGFSPAEDISFA